MSTELSKQSEGNVAISGKPGSLTGSVVQGQDGDIAFRKQPQVARSP
jgi:hypothetical protein